MGLPRILSGSRRIRFAFLVANGIAQASIVVVTAIVVQHGFDKLVLADALPTAQSAVTLGGVLLALILVGAWLRWRGQIDAEQLGQSYVHSVRVRLFRHLTRIGADGAGQMSRGAIILRFVGDLTAMRNWVSLGLARLTVSGLGSVLAVATLAVIEPAISIAVATPLVGATAIVLAIGPRLRATTHEVRRRRGRLAAMLNDRVSGIAVVEAFGQEQREQLRFASLSRGLRRSQIDRAHFVGLLRAMVEASASLAVLCALALGVLQVAMGNTSAGAVVAAVAVVSLLAPRLQELGRVYEYWNTATVARQKQEELFGLEPIGRPNKPSRYKALKPGPGVLELRNVSWNGVLQEISLKVAAGERFCVVGPNGAGKSSLLRVISGIVQPDRGKVLMDGQDLFRRAWVDLRKTFAMVSPDLPLLRGSLRLNLTYGAKAASEEELAEVINACDLKALIEDLKEGLDTRISENGAGLSSGERARIALARALLVKPRVLLLDEAEANLDRAAVHALSRTIDSFPGAVIYTTHDPARAAAADRIAELSQGRLISVGDPHDLFRDGDPVNVLQGAPQSVSSVQTTQVA